MENNNRRNFLKAGAILGSSLFLSPRSGFATATEKYEKTNYTPNNKTRILGTGKHRIEVAYGMGLGCMGMSWNRSFVPGRK